ncbi:MAG TPA: SAM-dependent methyltransferase, partial [Methanomicrobiales archaeon]|nr:SAM-dependent methyltransferase [Methanomicrobiales archaeon]
MRARRVLREDLSRIGSADWIDPERRIYLSGDVAYVPVRDGFSSDTEIPERTPYIGRGYQLLG